MSPNWAALTKRLATSDVRLGACRREERFVAGVQRAHRRHEPDDAAPWDVELRERLDDDHGWVASTSAV